MSDKLTPMPIDRLFRWILNEEAERGQIFGIPRELFFMPKETDVFRMTRYGQLLETPIGVAAGPHSQLTQNLIVSWLTGARYMELKTVQTLDEIEVAKPCIDVTDEGYNCEWSQELKIDQSIDEYVNAWIIIHLLKDKFGWGDPQEAGFIFNLSVGYDLKGIKNPNVQQFFAAMSDAGDMITSRVASLASFYPRALDVEIPGTLSDNITLSTMHGCPPDEIEKICRYLIEERHLHTALKLNPTLLGPDQLRTVLNEQLAYDINVPDETFEHDLKYPEALILIRSLEECARKAGVEFGLKLTNTLEVENIGRSLPESEKMTYLSGRALHPITILVAEKLQYDFQGHLDISFSAGADCFNVADIMACNIKPVTTCSDLLKPGGYGRLGQYLQELHKAMQESSAGSIDQFILGGEDHSEDVETAGLRNLRHYALHVVENPAYHQTEFPYENIKTARTLNAFDCIQAPCVESCSIEQDVPSYMYHTARGEFQEAHDVILKANPFPNVTGMVCDHLCQSKCTRINYDAPLQIREIKRFIAERNDLDETLTPNPPNGLKVAIIGAGPSGLSCAYFLALEGFKVTVYEAGDSAGGLAARAIPVFRLSDEGVKKDLDRITALGVTIHYEAPVDNDRFKFLKDSHDYVYLSVGAQNSNLLDIPGDDLDGVMNPLEFLSAVKQDQPFTLGPNVAVIGGGNSAMDAARTAHRLMGADGNVTVIYRRTRKEMPVALDEVEALDEEGITLLELTAPASIKGSDGSVSVLVCQQMKLGEKDDSGRPRPEPVPDSEFELPVDQIIPAIGQYIDFDLMDNEPLRVDPLTGETQHKKVFSGGDAVRGADSLINAIGDGKTAAESIIQQSMKDSRIPDPVLDRGFEKVDFTIAQSIRQYGDAMPAIGLERRDGFDMVHPTMAEEQAQTEAARCLYCDDVCDICVSVCPNRANISFESLPFSANLPSLGASQDGTPGVTNGTYSVQQRHQILNIVDFCNECGNCTTFCPTSGDPFINKPRMCLSEETFANEDDAYFLEGNTLKWRKDGKLESLTKKGDQLIYETPALRAQLDAGTFALQEMQLNNGGEKPADFSRAAQMYFLLKSLQDTYLYKDSP